MLRRSLCALPWPLEGPTFPRLYLSTPELGSHQSTPVSDLPIRSLIKQAPDRGLALDHYLLSLCTEWNCLPAQEPFLWTLVNVHLLPVHRVEHSSRSEPSHRRQLLWTLHPISLYFEKICKTYFMTRFMYFIAYFGAIFGYLHYTWKCFYFSDPCL